MIDDVHEAYSRDRLRRVVFYKNPDGSFGFREERWSEEPEEKCWFAIRWPDSRSDTLERAIGEASGRIDWFAESNSN